MTYHDKRIRKAQFIWGASSRARRPSGYSVSDFLYLSPYLKSTWLHSNLLLISELTGTEICMAHRNPGHFEPLLHRPFVIDRILKRV